MTMSLALGEGRGCSYNNVLKIESSCSGVGSTEVSSVSSKVLKVYIGKLIQLLKVHVSYVDKVRFSEDLYFPCYRVRL